MRIKCFKLGLISFILMGCSGKHSSPGSSHPDSTQLTPSLPHYVVPQGTDVGSAGDYIRILMEEGRIYASGVITRLDRKSIPSYLAEQANPLELSWLLENKENIQNDIKNAHHLWVKALPPQCGDANCGCNLRDGTVYFDLNRCQETIFNRTQAAELLVHESLHTFFGTDETKVRRIGAATFEILRNTGLSHSFPSWKNLPSAPSSFHKVNSDTLWIGTELMVWNEDNQVAYYSPDLELWRMEEPRNSIHDFTYELRLGGNGGKAWSANRLALFSCNFLPETGEHAMAGVVYHPETKLWSPISKIGAPPTCGTDLVGPMNHSVLYFGASNRLEEFSEGAVYFPEKNTWKPVHKLGRPSPRYGHSGIWTGKLAIFWGGFDNHDKSLQTGAIYDSEKDQWIPIPLTGAPSPRGNHIAVWTGKEMLIYGGRDKSKGEILNSGAAFNPKTGTWREISKRLILPPYEAGLIRPLKATWTGIELLVVNKESLFQYNPYLDKWSSDLDTTFSTPSPWRDNNFDYWNSHWTGVEFLFWNRLSNTGYLFRNP